MGQNPLMGSISNDLSKRSSKSRPGDDEEEGRHSGRHLVQITFVMIVPHPRKWALNRFDLIVFYGVIHSLNGIYKWVTGVTCPISGVITLLITGGPLLRKKRCLGDYFPFGKVYFQALW